MTYARLNRYHIMWIFLMFDLPTNTKLERKESARFRKDLERDGFTMYQFSVYVRYCGSYESMNVHIKRVKSLAPSKGMISILAVTDKQYSNIVNVWGEVAAKQQPKPIQLEFF